MGFNSAFKGLNVKQMPAELRMALVLSMYQVLCAVPMHVSTTFSSSGQKKIV